MQLDNPQVKKRKELCGDWQLYLAKTTRHERKGRELKMMGYAGPVAID